MTATTLEEKLDRPLLFPGLSWEQFKTLEPMLDIPGVRLSFLDGILEIQRMPGRKHEIGKERIGALLETYLLKAGIDFTPTGSLTLENESERVKCEADKSYELGADRERPDLAIEVVVTSGGIDKLEAYKRLQISEVWFWENSRLSLYALGEEGYEQIASSQLLPELDIDLLVRCVNMPSHVEAVKEFKRAIELNY
ncbi:MULTISPECIES: Uma2 family endonuclease [unclassified Microcoleus]|jgi:Uma2 family endonuclease|uniref:Uma2 family endonuclease n=1 Tax=unclassified Microcoleus TaxID=2642155 RepID=UPI001D8A4036|nr:MULTISPECIES: Uma2 family endonuclease [unclassified Microcoleus]MCC3502685.1 Uma2 family endonuclease [Microcoleus sp. PH2017_19_SFW_U_A]TAG92763.1 MAG: Uma2 family endonuclease [Oscillatoriales cyanobacterium]MCC3471691.1 Uma2 family endonuclease [Microcoleus sp. PH2017_13_LAR_U_A]MCC3484823.1 Uma2 family endonuclease [Microcoleus sp. PH2017_14_LAR_D_A]MCC3520927.1 Uma2 family endonuclease [Microcoleus sp. PH2017_20_SFW_D_A]